MLKSFLHQNFSSPCLQICSQPLNSLFTVHNSLRNTTTRVHNQFKKIMFHDMFHDVSYTFGIILSLIMDKYIIKNNKQLN